MKKIAIFSLTACFALLSAGAMGQTKGQQKKANAQTEDWRYEIESVAVGQQAGSVVIKVWSYSKKTDVAQEQSKKNAVHGVVFKGVPAKDRIPGKRPLVDASTAAQYTDWFKAFFADGGDYMRYVALTNSGAAEVMKSAKKEYKVGVTVTVQYNELRKALEESGAVKRLGGGF
jgi:hypothetical protein